MSADPEVDVKPQRLSGGNIIHNVIYTHTDGNELEILSNWHDTGVTREYDQTLVRPASRLLSRHHPCAELNKKLIECSEKCAPEMRLGGRSAICYQERQSLMRCFVKNKNWNESKDAKHSWLKWW